MSYRLLFRQLALELSYRTVRHWFGTRTVIRDVQGVSLAMPWYHRLPDYARLFPTYGQNLIDLAVGLAETDKPLGVIDVGANIGDSARQLLAKVDARILCIEGDPEYLPYLERNVGSDDRCVIEFGLLLTDAAKASGLGAVRKGGDTRFAQGGTGGAAAALTVADLRNRHPELPPIRLVKSDTEGYDTILVPALARAYADTRPLLFFEYYPELIRMAGVPDPTVVWGSCRPPGTRMWASGTTSAGRFRRCRSMRCRPQPRCWTGAMPSADITTGTSRSCTPTTARAVPCWTGSLPSPGNGQP
ncbi:hypothetical protein NIIDMKKI_50690 [Mycobacterium kansasii]|nr:hypothetical protein NIIDMKKI_50690 [Mycobacterium kansasii]